MPVSWQPDNWRVAIGYDTRHRSRHFAELCAEILVAVGIRVMFLDGHRATPELAMTVRHYQCQAGIMISASHNRRVIMPSKSFGMMVRKFVRRLMPR